MLVSLLYGVTARDPLAILTSAAALLITAAGQLPAGATGPRRSIR
jgi:hypothetical protein